MIVFEGQLLLKEDFYFYLILLLFQPQKAIFSKLQCT